MWIYVSIFIIISILLLYLSFVVTSPKRFNFAGAHVVITGGSSGIGKAIAIEVAKRGANITLMARNKGRLDEAKEEVEASFENRQSQKVACVAADVGADYGAIQAAIKQAEDEVGPVDVLVNSAGASLPFSFSDTTVDDFERLMNINFHGSMKMTKAVIEGMKERKRGMVVYISSMAGQLGLYGYTAYSASKFALRGFAESLQMEVKPYNVRIMLTFPPDTDTPMFNSENDIKPKETELISQTAGFFKPDQVGRNIVEDMEACKFLSSQGFDGFMLTNLTAGMSPATSITEALWQVFLPGIVRFVSLGHLWYFDRIVAKCKKNRDAGLEKPKRQ